MKPSTARLLSPHVTDIYRDGSAHPSGHLKARPTLCWWRRSQPRLQLHLLVLVPPTGTLRQNALQLSCPWLTETSFPFNAVVHISYRPSCWQLGSPASSSPLWWKRPTRSLAFNMHLILKNNVHPTPRSGFTLIRRRALLILRVAGRCPTGAVGVARIMREIIQLERRESLQSRRVPSARPASPAAGCHFFHATSAAWDALHQGSKSWE